MSALVDPQGKPIVTGADPSDKCPNCGSPEKYHVTERMFGGHWKQMCNQCGYTFRSGQGVVPEAEEDE